MGYHRLMDPKAMRARFDRLAETLGEDERELVAEAMRQSPGERMLRGLRLSQAFADDYRRQLQDPAVAAAEDARALAKADLHTRWREHQRQGA
jgi:hypothetical protein